MSKVIYAFCFHIKFKASALKGELDITLEVIFNERTLKFISLSFSLKYIK